VSDHFFSRWSRRKQDAALGRATDEPLPTAAAPVAAAPVAQTPPPQALPSEASETPQEANAPLPSLEDAQALSPTSDFQPFMRRGVTPDVRNAAMKKLFADPHFNVMDGLDIYIGDYTQPDPLPAGMLEQMVGAQFLNLVPPKEATAEGASDRADAEKMPDQSPQSPETAAVVAQSPDSAAPMAATNIEHDDTDLQLQPDPAAADPQAGAGTR
jgi:Protein of unknown function (DUF3306)